MPSLLHAAKLALALALLPIAAYAQGAQAAKAPAYDIVSIHQNKSDSDSMSINSTHSTFNGVNLSLMDLLVNAYNIKQDLISGVPHAIDSARFDITAKIVDPGATHPTEEQERTMLAAILTDRYHLKAHTETKQLPVYELTVLAPGTRLKPSGSDGTHGTMSMQRGKLTGKDMPISTLVYILAGPLHRTVVDKTGLTGGFDLTLTWTPDDDTDPQSQAPPLPTALQEQLGLKLRPAKGPVDTLVVDHVEMPSEN